MSEGARGRGAARLLSGPPAVRAGWLAGLPALLHLGQPGGARADVLEISARPFFETRYGATASRPTGNVQPNQSGLALGGGLVAGLGLSFEFTATVRYLYDFTGELQGSRLDGAAESWSQTRHTGLLGLAWAPSDVLTPVLSLEAGWALARATDVAVLDAQGRRDPIRSATVPETGDWRRVLTGRASAGLEWRFSDFLSVSPTLLVEHADGWGYGAQVWLGLYRYL